MEEVLQKKVTYFVISDIHSFYDEMIDALDKAGYDKENPEHVLIVCGDIFDRGTKPLEVYNFLRSIQKERRILIRGNHEYLLRYLVERREWLGHDQHNKTIHTVCYIAGLDFDTMLKASFNYILREVSMDKINKYRENNRKKLFNNRKIKEILRWIASDDWVDYYELDDFIFVHAFIPTIFDFNKDKKIVVKDWRELPREARAWYNCTWVCPYDIYEDVKDELDKTIVCGHWHTSDFWNFYLHNGVEVMDIMKNNPIFYMEDKKLIGLDQCVPLTKSMNVLVIKDNELELHNHDGEVKYVARNK